MKYHLSVQQFIFHPAAVFICVMLVYPRSSGWWNAGREAVALLDTVRPGEAYINGLVQERLTPVH